MTPVELAHKAMVREEARKAKKAVEEARREVAAGNQMISHDIRAACKEAEEAREEVMAAQSQVFIAMDLGRPAYLAAHDRLVGTLEKLKSAEAKETDAVTSAGRMIKEQQTANT